MIDVTNGTIRITAAGNSVAIIALDPREVITVYEDELPWVINTLGDIHRELIANARRVEDAAALDEWDADALASMMTG